MISVTADPLNPLCCSSSPGGGGGCAVRRRGRPPEGQRQPEPHQPDRPGQAWPSTSTVQGTIQSNLCSRSAPLIRELHACDLTLYLRSMIL